MSAPGQFREGPAQPAVALPLFVPVFFAGGKVPLVRIPVSVVICHRGAPLGVAGLGPLRGCREGGRRTMQPVPRLVGVVKALEVRPVFVGEDAVVTCGGQEERKGRRPVESASSVSL